MNTHWKQMIQMRMWNTLINIPVQDVTPQAEPVHIDIPAIETVREVPPIVTIHAKGFSIWESVQ